MSKDIFFDKKRQYLHEVLPLDTPFSVNLEPSSLCNIKCCYCIHSASESHIKEVNPTRKNMDTNTFRNIMNQLSKFPRKLKTLVINGVGEPLCNPFFTELLTIAKTSAVADRVEFFTNATLLTPQLSEKIIASGVDRIKISLQGLSTEQYEKTCARAVDFDKLYNNIKYLSSIRGKTELMIKIINIGLNGDSDSENFFSLFESICDKAGIEYVSPFFHGIDYSKMMESGERTKNKYGAAFSRLRYCPIPFYRLYINVLGDVYVCYTCRKPTAPINCLGEEDLLKIWNGYERKLFLRRMLSGGGDCFNCTMLYDAAFSEYDNIDAHAEKILNKII